jgi:hypothetical protein
MAAQWRTVRTVTGLDSRAVSVELCGEDLPFDYGTHGKSGHLMPLSEEQARRHELRVGLERSGDPLEGRWSLERGGNLLEGRWTLERSGAPFWGAQPLSEVEIGSRVIGALIRWALGAAGP